MCVEFVLKNEGDEHWLSLKFFIEVTSSTWIYMPKCVVLDPTVIQKTANSQTVDLEINVKDITISISSMT